MSPRRSASGSSSNGRSALAVIAVALVAIGLTMLVRAKPTPALLDPSSGSRSGARGVVLLLREQGVDVEVATELRPTESGRVVVLVDRLNPEQRVDLRNWAKSGGLVVMADPTSTFLGSPGLAESEAPGGEPSESDDESTFNPNAITSLSVDKGRCDIPALSRLRTVSFEADRRPLPPTVPQAANDAVAIPIEGGDRQCFSQGGGAAFVVARPTGEGLVVGLGENYVWSNDLLASGDNAALATALLAPEPGGRVVVLRGTGASPTVEVGGEQTLLDLVRPGVWMAILTAVIGFVWLALSQAWRVGKPVNEPLPATLAGSELAVATGNLMQRAGHAQRAAEMLRYRFHRDLCSAYVVPPTTEIGDLDRVVTSAAGLPSGAIAGALRGHPLSNDGELSRLARDIDGLRVAALRDGVVKHFVPTSVGAFAPTPATDHQEIR